MKQTNEIVKKFLNNNDLTENLIQKVVSEFTNAIMFAERTNYLENNPDDNGNGYRDRTLQTAGSKISISVPRTRKNNFRPAILPQPYQRFLPDYKELVYSLIAAGNSKAQVREIFYNMGFILSEQAISEIYKELEIKITDFKTCQLPENIAILFIDGKYIKIKKDNKVQEAVLYILLGYDFDGNKHILGFYVFFGKETIQQWKRIFNDLLNRGLKNVLLFVCDNLSGMTETLNLIFHKPDIQLCIVHIKRNIRRHLPSEDANIIINKIDELKASSLSAKEASEAFKESIKPFMTSYKYFLDKLQKDSKFIFTFLDYPSKLQKIICTTNPVESLNNQVEKVSTKYEGYFQSENLLDINMFLLKNKWERKWSKSVSPFVAKFAHFFRKKLFLISDSKEVM